MYQVYTDQQVFEDGTANIVCNLIHQYLIDEFDAPTIAANFFLTGMPARIIQEDPDTDVSVISFGTSQDAIFEFCVSKIAEKLNASGTVRFNDQGQMVYNEQIFVEFWHLLSPGTLVTENDIVMQDKANIPAYII
tara:strand:+ start:457 stop:861 length:405 start_codon:yes stop_codon:yes gene_type:complete